MIITVWILNAIKIIILLSFLVLIHEGGHFLVAKKCGMLVEEFSIGFGPIMFSKKKGDTAYSIRWILLGGYVNIAGEAEESDDERAFCNKPVWQRLLVIIAGATINVLFGLIVLTSLAFSTGRYGGTTISQVLEESPTQESDIRIGDKVLKANGKDVHVILEIQDIFAKNKNKPITLELQRGNEILTKTLNPLMDLKIYVSDDGIVNDDAYKDGYEEYKTKVEEPISYEEYSRTYVDYVKQLGLRLGDKIVAIKGKKVSTLSEIKDEIKDITDVTSKFTVIRDEKEMDVNVLVEYMRTYYIGIATNVETDLQGILYNSLYSTKYIIITMYESLFELVTGKLSVEALSGPIGIANEITKTNGWLDFLYLAALISLNLGIVNLLPILPLDGGKFVLVLIEGITKKRVSQKIEDAIAIMGLLVFLGLSVFVTYFDIMKLK